MSEDNFGHVVWKFECKILMFIGQYIFNELVVCEDTRETSSPLSLTILEGHL
jgi:hypothetical protein